MKMRSFAIQNDLATRSIAEMGQSRKRPVSDMARAKVQIKAYEIILILTSRGKRYNVGTEDADISGWELRSGRSRSKLFGNVASQGFRVVYGVIPAQGSTIGLYNSVGVKVDEYDIAPDGFVAGRVPDGAGSFHWVTQPTPGSSNSPPHVKPTIPPAAKKKIDCPKDAFAATAAESASLGFSGDFCRSFDDAIERANPVERMRLANTMDQALLSKVSLVVAERQVASERELKVAKISFTNDEVIDAMSGLVGSSMADISVDEEVTRMNRKFRALLVDILTNGTQAERGQMRLQLEYYLERKMSHEKTELTIDPIRVRLLLAKNEKEDLILAEIGL